MRSGLGPDDLPDLMNGEDLGILATRRPDDSIMLSPVWWERRDEAFYIWAEDDSDRKVRHIERDPRVTFLVPNQHRPYQGYEIRGEATLSRDPTLFYDILGRTTARWDGPDGRRGVGVDLSGRGRHTDRTWHRTRLGDRLTTRNG